MTRSQRLASLCLSASVAAGAYSLTVAAQPPTEDLVAIYGVGVSSCGTWLAARVGAKTNNGDVRELQFVSWLHGFASAYNIWRVPSNGGPASVLKTDDEGLRAFIDKYCRENPTAIFQTAVAALIADQLKR